MAPGRPRRRAADAASSRETQRRRASACRCCSRSPTACRASTRAARCVSPPEADALAASVEDTPAQAEALLSAGSLRRPPARPRDARSTRTRDALAAFEAAGDDDRRSRQDAARHQLRARRARRFPERARLPVPRARPSTSGPATRAAAPRRCARSASCTRAPATRPRGSISIARASRCARSRRRCDRARQDAQQHRHQPQEPGRPRRARKRRSTRRAGCSSSSGCRCSEAATLNNPGLVLRAAGRRRRRGAHAARGARAVRSRRAIATASRTRASALGKLCLAQGRHADARAWLDVGARRLPSGIS